MAENDLPLSQRHRRANPKRKR